MLASLLPGLREIRSPLAAGYLWLVTLWLAFAERFPPPGQSTGLVQDIYVVAQAAGASAVLVAASFTAYIFGALSVQLSNLFAPTIGVLRPRGMLMRKLAGWRDRRRARKGSTTSHSVLSENGRVYLHEAVIAELAKRAGDDPEMLAELRALHDLGISGTFDDPAVLRTLVEIRYDIVRYAEELEKELPTMPLRMISDDREIYTEFDRLRAEAEFRAAIALPLAALVLVIGWRVSPWWWLALALPTLLVFDARRSATAAADVLAEAIRSRATRSAPPEEHRPLLRSPDAAVIAVAATQYNARNALVLHAANLVLAGHSKEAEGFYQAAAAQGDPKAKFWVALHTKLSDKDVDELLAAAAAGGVPEAAQLIAEAGPAGFAEMRLAIAGDNRDAMLAAGRRYQERRDLVRAEEWYRRVVDPDDKDDIGRDEVEALMRETGRGPSADRWRQKSAEIRDRLARQPVAEAAAAETAPS